MREGGVTMNSEISSQGDSPIYGAGTLKRDRRTKAQIEQLDRQIIDVLRDDHPQSVRHVFYRMTNPRLPEPVEKSDKGYRTVQTRVKELRRAGRVPYSWITDATRRGYFTNTYGSPADFGEPVRDCIGRTSGQTRTITVRCGSRAARLRASSKMIVESLPCLSIQPVDLRASR